jgi:subtilase family serine protease
MLGARRHRLLILAIASTVVLGGSTSAARAATRTTPVRVTLALAPRDPSALAAYATAVTTPGSPLYHHYLTVAQFARRFGASPSAIANVREAVAAHGMAAGAATPNGLALEVSSATRSTNVLDAYGQLKLLGDRALDRLVQAVIEPSAAAPRASVTMHTGPIFDPIRPRRARLASVPQAAGTAGPQPCAAARAFAATTAAHTADQIALAYGLSGYYPAGDQGLGVTIALYELEPFSASDIAAYQACYKTGAAVSTVAIDGGAGSGPGDGEAAMDVEDLIGLAPQAAIKVYEGPPTGAGAYDTYSRIISDDTAQVISTSWGMCEALKGSVATSAENTLFEEAAVQGQSLLASSGDDGSDDCGDGRPAVDDPASQPWVTAVGGTSLGVSGNAVWNDWLGASGGGVSSLWGRPEYQNAAAQRQSGVTCGSSGTACREVPDISVDGDPAAGYVAYYDGSWRSVGGTSVAAPTVAALAALADASPACAGDRVGFLNPGLYQAAAHAYAANFTDVTSGSNGFGSVAGFVAGPGYDMASGLGTPTALLGQTLCIDSAVRTAPGNRAKTVNHPANIVRLGSLGNRIGLVGTAVHIRVRARDGRGLKLTFTAFGLPAGLTINHRSGVISGTPLRAGSQTVRVRAADARGTAATVFFRWTIRRRSAH